MADLRSEFVGIKSPNPFWLASAPPTDKEYNVRRAFEAGWGGVVWKTLGLDPHIVNVNGPRYGAVFGADRRLMGLNTPFTIDYKGIMLNKVVRMLSNRQRYMYKKQTRFSQVKTSLYFGCLEKLRFLSLEL